MSFDRSQAPRCYSGCCFQEVLIPVSLVSAAQSLLCISSFQGNVSLISDTSATLQIEQLEDVVVEENWRNNDVTVSEVHFFLTSISKKL